MTYDNKLGADLAALAFPADPDGLILVMVDGARAQVYEGLFIGRGRFAFDPAAWARALVRWRVVDGVLPGAPHATISPLAGMPSRRWRLWSPITRGGGRFLNVK